MSEAGNKVISFFAALGASILAALSIGVYETWIPLSTVDNIPYAELGFFGGLLAVIAVIFYLRK